MVTIAEIKDVLAQSFERMLETLEQVDADLEIYPDWTVKEVVAHLIGWDTATTNSLSSFIQGGVPDVVSIHGVDAYNTEMIAQYAGLSLEQLVQEWQSERQRLLDTMTALEESQLKAKINFPWGGTDTVSRMLFFLSNHETKHMNDIITVMQS